MFAFAPDLNPGIRALRQIPSSLMTTPIVRKPKKANTNVFTFTAAPAITLTERLRRAENVRLTGRVELPGIEKRCLSPQSSCKIPKTERPEDDFGGVGPRHGLGASRRNCGRKPEYKNKRRNIVAW